MKSTQSRFEIHSRRSALARSVALGALVALPGLACGSSDKDVFSTSSDTTPVTEPAATESPSTDAPVTVDTGATSSTAASTASGDTFPSGAEMLVNFTFSSTSGGPTRNPYIAVWVEDTSGNLVKTVSLWAEQSFKAEKYIHELRNYYSISSGDLSLSSATRVAGEYSVTWDGTDNDGNVVPAGEYTVYIEAAREHGPYELTGSKVTIGTDAFSIDLPDEGELTAASLEYVV